MSNESNLLADFKMSFSVSPYHYFPIQIRILSEARANSKIIDDTIAINFLTITSCTAFIETILFESLSSVIVKKENEHSDSVIRTILLKIQDDISTATFKTFDQIAKDVLGKGLNCFTKNPIWEAIRVLFALRNQIIHGKVLSMEYVYNGNYLNGTYGKNYNSIVKYLIKKKLVEADNINIDHLFSNKVAKFFIEMTRDFFVDVTKNISREFNTPTYNGFEHMRKDLENLACV